jgi:hypothetical protein
MLLPLLRDLDENGVSAQEGDDADHDQVLERGEHVQLQPEAVVEAEDGAEADVEPDAAVDFKKLFRPKFTDKA